MVNAETVKISRPDTAYLEVDQSDYKFAVLDQIKAADYTLRVIKEIDKTFGLDNSLSAVKETDVFRLRRGLCLPSASATCINWLANSRLIGDNDANLKVGDIYGLLLPFHGKKDFQQEEARKLEHGWLFASAEGDVYHQAIVAFSEGLDTPALAVTGFDSVSNFRPLLDKGGAVAISLDNRFVLDHTLAGNGELTETLGGHSRILVDGPEGVEFRDFEEGRHVVALLKFSKDSSAIIVDSFRLPQMAESSSIIELGTSEIDSYLDYSTDEASRGILFARNRNDLYSFQSNASNVVVPNEIVDYVREKVNRLVDSR